MTYFPTNVMKNILSFTDDRIEKKQRNLWNQIIAVRRLCLEINNLEYVDITITDEKQTIILNVYGGSEESELSDIELLEVGRLTNKPYSDEDIEYLFQEECDDLFR